MSSHPPGGKYKQPDQKTYKVVDRVRTMASSSTPSGASRFPSAHTSYQHQNKAAVLQSRAFLGDSQLRYPPSDIAPANAAVAAPPPVQQPQVSINQPPLLPPPQPSTVTNGLVQMSQGIAAVVLNGLRNHPREILDGLETRLAPCFDSLRSEIDAVKTGLKSFKDELSDMKEEMSKTALAHKTLQLKMIDAFQTKTKELENVIGSAHRTDKDAKDTIMGRLNDIYYGIGDVFEKMADDEAEGLRPEPKNNSIPRDNHQSLNLSGVQANATPGPSRTKLQTPQSVDTDDYDDGEEEEEEDTAQPSEQPLTSTPFKSITSHPVGPAVPLVNVSPGKSRPQLRIQTENLVPKINVANVDWPPHLLREQEEYNRKEAEKEKARNAKANQEAQGKDSVNENRPMQQLPSSSNKSTSTHPFQPSIGLQEVPEEVLRLDAEKPCSSPSSVGSLSMGELQYPMSAVDIPVNNFGCGNYMGVGQSASTSSKDDEEEYSDDEGYEGEEEKDVGPMHVTHNDAEMVVVEADASGGMDVEETAGLPLESEVVQEAQQEEQNMREEGHEEEQREGHEEQQPEKVEVVQEEQQKEQQLDDPGVTEQEKDERMKDTGTGESREDRTRIVIRELSPVDAHAERDNFDKSDNDDSNGYQEEVEESEDDDQDRQSSPVVVTMLNARGESPLFLPEFGSSFPTRSPTPSKEVLETEEDNQEEEEAIPVPNPLQESGNSLEITSLDLTSDSMSQPRPVVDVSQFTQPTASQTTVVSSSQEQRMQDSVITGDNDNGKRPTIKASGSRTDSTSSAEAAQVLAELTTLSEPESSDDDDDDEQADEEEEEQFDELASDGLELQPEPFEETPMEAENEMESIEQERLPTPEPGPEASESIQSFSTMTRSLNAPSSGSPIQSFTSFGELSNHEVTEEIDQPSVALQAPKSPSVTTTTSRLKTPTPINRPQPQLPVTPAALPDYLSPVNSPVATPIPNQVKARKRKLELEGAQNQSQPPIRSRLSLDTNRSQSQSTSKKLSKTATSTDPQGNHVRTASAALSSLTPLSASVAGSSRRPSKEVQKSNSKAAAEPIYISSSEDEVVLPAPTPTQARARAQAQTQGPSSRRGTRVLMECIDLTESPEKKAPPVKKMAPMSTGGVDPVKLKEKKRIKVKKERMIAKEKEKEKKLAEEKQERERKELEAAKKKEIEKKMLPDGAEDSDDADVIPANKFRPPVVLSGDEDAESEGHSSANLASSSSGRTKTKKLDLRTMMAKRDAIAEGSKASTRIKKRKHGSDRPSSSYQGSNRDGSGSDNERPLKRARNRQSTGSRSSSHGATWGTETETPTKSKGKGKEVSREIQGLGGPPPVSPVRVKWPAKDMSSAFHQKFIGCDMCKLWFHHGCVGIQKNDTRLNATEIFICPICTTGGSKASWGQTGDKKPSPETTCNRTDCGHKKTEQNEYFVKRIIGRKGKLVGRVRVFEWLVDWDGYPTSDATWEKEKSMGDPKQLIETFNEAAKEEGLDLESDPNLTVLLKDARKNGFKA